LGDLGIDDANDDAVTVTVVTGPTNGTLLLTTGGTYTYTPSAALAAAGGTDSFALAITDNGWHPLSTATATTTVTVPITVIATTDTAPAVPNTLSKLIVTNRSTATLTLTGLHSMGTASGTRVGDVLLPQADVTVYLSTSGSGGGVELLYLTVTTGATIVTYAAGLTVIGSSLRLDCISQGGTCSTQGNNTVIFT
jgi:hypothetical protein